MRSPAKLKAALFGAFAAVAISFFASTLISIHALDAVYDNAVEERDTAGRSLEYLLTIQAGFFHLSHDLDHIIYAEARGEPAPQADLNRLIADLTQTLRNYDALPAIPGKQPIDAELRTSIDRMEVLTGRIVQARESGTLRSQQMALNEALTQNIEHARELIGKAIKLQARYADQLQQRIAHARRWARHKTYLLDLLAAFLTALIAVLLTRAFSRFAQAQQEILRLQQARADELELFAARVSHDIMNPLATIRLASVQARRQVGVDATAVDRIDAGVARVQRIVRGLYDFARSGAQPTPGVVTAVGPIIEDVVEELRPEAEARHVELRAEPFSPRSVAASSGVLTSLTENLVRNALKHGGGEGGRITVRVSDGKKGVRIEVEDTGPGVPEDVAEHLFEPYHRGKDTSTEGLGLGLATVKRLSEAHGGASGFRSKPGAGSTFWYELPRGEG